MEKKEDIASARIAADRFLKFRPRSAKEIREKLASKDYSKTVSDTVVAELLENGLLNDEEFARAWAESRVLSKKLGTRKVLNELAQKGISRDILAKTEEYLSSKYDEAANARELLDKKFRGNAAGSGADKKKLVDFLVRNGYSFSQADKTVRDILREKEEERS